MKTHDNQKPFQCTICNRGYNTAAALTSHMQNHKKQAAILAAGGNPQALNYSPRSTGSASSNNSSLHKRRYALANAADSSPNNLNYPKRTRSLLICNYCNKSEFQTKEQLNAHLQTFHEKDLKVEFRSERPSKVNELETAFQLTCEYCNMKFPNVQAMFQHMRATHVDRLTSPNSYFEHFNRLAATGTFSPRLITNKPTQGTRNTLDDNNTIKVEPKIHAQSPKRYETKHQDNQDAEAQQPVEEEPTDLSQHKRYTETPRTEQPPGIFFCNQCNAGMPDFDSFRSHLKSHLSQGFCLVCPHCGMTLRGQLEYERHIISHFLTTSAEYNCEANCKASYTKCEDLQKHLLDKHVLIMYKCALCAETFESKMAIQVHFACAHATETKSFRCTACMEAFYAETDFNVHVKSRHQATINGGVTGGEVLASNSLQCMFCHIVCSSELEMHFHLAAHARQFRCPSCPETFHVEFLLDRHMQSQHGGQEAANKLAADNKDTYETTHIINNHSLNSLYMNALLGKSPSALTASQATLQHNNNNNSMLDYNVALVAAAQLEKGLLPSASALPPSKLYNPLHVDTNAIKQHPALMYGFNQRYFDTNRSLLDMYAQHQQQQQQPQQQQQQQQQQPPRHKGGNYFLHQQAKKISPTEAQSEIQTRTAPKESSATSTGLSCGICERNDFRTEAELNSHRKIAHNMKTGVSLRCAYCSGNFKSRNELEHHMKTCHNSTGKHKCLICDEVFPSPAILAEHRLQHSMVGQSGKCSHCAKTLNDVHAFKAHLSDHNNDSGQLPVQCICCRQTLHSDFEIGLHAK